MTFIKIFLNYILFVVVASFPLAILSSLRNNIVYTVSLLFIIFIQGVYVFYANKKFNLGLYQFDFNKFKKLILISITIIFLIQLIFNYLSSINITSGSSNPYLEKIFANHIFYLYLYAVIIGPILEEIFLRGIFYKLCIPRLNNLQLNKIKVITLIFINALIFSLLHSPKDILAIICYFSGSIILSVSYLKTNDIKIPIFIHSFNNLISIILCLSF